MTTKCPAPLAVDPAAMQGFFVEFSLRVEYKRL
jgi:hypothetical protein